MIQKTVAQATKKKCLKVLFSELKFISNYILYTYYAMLFKIIEKCRW